MPATNTIGLHLRGQLLGPDIFDMGLYFTPSGTATVPSDASTLAALLAEIVGLTAFTALTTELRTYIHSSDKFTQWALYSYPSGGSHAAAAVNQNVSLAGTAATRVLPNQCAVVVSLRSPFAGRQNRGRFYVPVTTQNVITSGTSQLTSTNCTSLATAVNNFLSSMNGHSFTNVAGNALRPCVSSRGNSALILTVLVDSIIDTQRRRRNKVSANNTASQTVFIGS